MITYLNQAINRWWPCPCSLVFGYFLSPFTLGLSLLLPNMCMSDAKIALEKAIEKENEKSLYDKGLELEYKQAWSTSWLELSVMSEERKEEIKEMHE